MLTSSCAWVFSCDLIFTATFFGFPDTLLVHPLCPAERERDPSGCRAPGLTPELPVHVVLVTPLLVLPLLRLQALVGLPGVQRQPHRHFYFIDFPRKFLVRARCGGFEKALDFTRAGYRIVQSTLLLSFFFEAPDQYRLGHLSDGYIAVEQDSSRHNRQLWSLCPVSGLSFQCSELG